MWQVLASSHHASVFQPLQGKCNVGLLHQRFQPGKVHWMQNKWARNWSKRPKGPDLNKMERGKGRSKQKWWKQEALTCPEPLSMITAGWQQGVWIKNRTMHKVYCHRLKRHGNQNMVVPRHDLLLLPLQQIAFSVPFHCSSRSTNRLKRTSCIWFQHQFCET